MKIFEFLQLYDCFYDCYLQIKFRNKEMNYSKLKYWETLNCKLLNKKIKNFYIHDNVLTINIENIKEDKNE